MPTFVVKEDQNNSRLDQVLVTKLSLTRSQIQKQFSLFNVLINDKPAKLHTLVETGDTVSYLKIKTEKTKIVLPKLEVLYEDDDILVINKPTHLIIHHVQERKGQPSLVDVLLKERPKIKKVGDDPMRPGIVHRLDKDVSGAMVVAKTQKAFEHLKKQFQAREIEKIYLALAYGTIVKDHDKISFPITRSRKLGRMVARVTEGKEAITEFDVLKRYKTSTYVSVHILTGRTHQIRVHFRAINHPIVGDKLYGKNFMRHIKPIELDRIFLHAHKLSFDLMNGERKTIIVPLPNELQKILDTLPKK